MKSTFPGAVPEIPVRDLNAAIEYYCRCLGFSLDWSGEDIGLAGISKGDCRMFLATESFRKHHGNVGPILIWLNLEGEDEVDSLYREWRDNGVEMLAEPESKPWGLREFTAADPDGNLFRVFYDFATPARENDAA